MTKLMLISSIAAVMLISSNAFLSTQLKRSPALQSLQFAKGSDDMDSMESFQPISFGSDEKALNPAMFVLPAAVLATMMPQVADANEYGILAGKTASLIHPVTNLLLFATSIYSAFLGWNWKRLREIGGELKTLTAELPTLSTGAAKFPITDQISAINTEISSLRSASTPDDAKISALTSDLSKLNGAMELNAQIADLTATRKSLMAMNLRDKHWLTGSILLGAGVTVSILGAFNTYMRAGKLFPGTVIRCVAYHCVVITHY